MKDKLTNFQEQFCREYVKTGNASEAYRTVSPNAKNWLDKSVWEKACHMMARVNVGSRIAELQAQCAIKANASIESLAAELDTHIAMAVALSEPGVAVAAVMGKAKLFGFLVDKKEIRTGLLDNLDFEQLRLVNDALATLAIAGPVTDADTSETVQ